MATVLHERRFVPPCKEGTSPQKLLSSLVCGLCAQQLRHAWDEVVLETPDGDTVVLTLDLTQAMKRGTPVEAVTLSRGDKVKVDLKKAVLVSAACCRPLRTADSFAVEELYSIPTRAHLSNEKMIADDDVAPGEVVLATLVLPSARGGSRLPLGAALWGHKKGAWDRPLAFEDVADESRLSFDAYGHLGDRANCHMQLGRIGDRDVAVVQATEHVRRGEQLRIVHGYVWYLLREYDRSRCLFSLQILLKLHVECEARQSSIDLHRKLLKGHMQRTTISCPLQCFRPVETPVQTKLRTRTPLLPACIACEPVVAMANGDELMVVGNPPPPDVALLTYMQTLGRLCKNSPGDPSQNEDAVKQMGALLSRWCDSTPDARFASPAERLDLASLVLWSLKRGGEAMRAAKDMIPDRNAPALQRLFQMLAAVWPQNEKN